jgi:hypothetical protein
MRRYRVFWAIVLTLSATPPVIAQTTAPTDTQSLDELSKKIEEGKAEKAKKAAAEKSKAAQHQEAERKKEAAEGRMATVVIRSDAPCQLYVNGEQKTVIQAGTSQVKVSGGQNLIDCVSTEESGAKYSNTIATHAGENTVLAIELAPSVQYVQGIKQQAALARQEKLACEAHQDVFQEVATGVVRQCRTNLEWTTDDGSSLGWDKAESRCQGKGAGFRLPTAAELQGLTSSSLTTNCGGPVCKTSPKLGLRSFVFWSNDSENDTLVSLTHVGLSVLPYYTITNPPSKYTSAGVLCVRP